VTLNSEGYQLLTMPGWILKLLSGPRICLVTNLLYQYTRTLAAYVFAPSVFGENIPKAEFGMISEISAETACWDIERK
jgi:hypothetical protein